jgi:hypothetical protein
MIRFGFNLLPLQMRFSSALCILDDSGQLMYRRRPDCRSQAHNGLAKLLMKQVQAPPVANQTSNLAIKAYRACIAWRHRESQLKVNGDQTSLIVLGDRESNCRPASAICRRLSTSRERQQAKCTYVDQIVDTQVTRTLFDAVVLFGSIVPVALATVHV